MVSAAERGADIVQMFLADPQGWKKPPVASAGPGSCGTATSQVVVHSPYSSTSPRSTTASASRRARSWCSTRRSPAEVGRDRPGRARRPRHAAARTTAKGFDNWRKFVERQQAEGGFAVPILIENTAGGENAMARSLDALARLWDAVGEFGVGFCLDTCHAFAAGLELVDVVERVTRDHRPHRSGAPQQLPRRVRLRPRPARQHRQGHHLARRALAAVCAAAGAPVVVETPAEGQAADIAFLRERLAVTGWPRRDARRRHATADGGHPPPARVRRPAGWPTAADAGGDRAAHRVHAAAGLRQQGTVHRARVRRRRAAAGPTTTCASTATSATPTSSTCGSAATSTSTSSRTCHGSITPTGARGRHRRVPGAHRAADVGRRAVRPQRRRVPALLGPAAWPRSGCSRAGCWAGWRAGGRCCGRSARRWCSTRSTTGICPWWPARWPRSSSCTAGARADRWPTVPCSRRCCSGWVSRSSSTRGRSSCRWRSTS